MVLGNFEEQIPFLKEKGEKKKREKLGFARRSGLGWLASLFLLLRDQTTYKKRFEEVQGKKNQNPNLIF